MKNTAAFIVIVLVSLQLGYAQNTILIEGKLNNNTEFNSLTLNRAIDGALIATSDISKKGEFSFDASIESADFYSITLSESKYMLMILSPGEKVNIVADLNDLYHPEITGSDESQRLFKMLNSLMIFEERLDSVTKLINEAKFEYIKEELGKDYSSLANLMIIDQLPTIDNYEIYKEVESAMMTKYSDNQLVKDLSVQVDEMSFLRPGTFPPEIELPDTAGNNISLSSLKGKIVLIDFWASWCKPCLQVNPEYVKLYKKFSKKNFEIYAISFDEKKEAWVNAIKSQNLNWIHVSDLKYSESDLIKTFRIEGIPFNILIDQDGKVVATRLSAEMLEKQLLELTGKQ